MTDSHHDCSICGATFEPQFSYQIERQRLQPGNEQVSYFCSQQCLSRSHTRKQGVCCDACGVAFAVTHPAQVFYHEAQRRYCCSQDCRDQLQRRAQTPRPPQAEVVPVVEAQAQVKRSAARPTDGPQVIAVFNQKGGTGKTTTAVTLAAGLAQSGLRTLLVDTDGQGNVAVSLGLSKPSRTLYHVLVMGVPAKDAILSARPNLDVLAANETLAAAELYLAGRQNRDRMLKTRLASTRDDYDAIVVDCSPSLSLLNQNALVFSDAVLCPVACDYLSLVGVRQVVKTIKNVNRLLGHPVTLWGVLPTLYDRRARICNEALDTLREHFGERCLPPIRAAIRAKEAPAQGKTLFEYGTDENVTQDYAHTVRRLLGERNQDRELLASA